MTKVPEQAIDAAIKELWGLNVDHVAGDPYWGISSEDLREMVADALRAAYPLMRPCRCVCHVGVQGSWQTHACDHCHPRR